MNKSLIFTCLFWLTSTSISFCQIDLSGIDVGTIEELNNPLEEGCDGCDCTTDPDVTLAGWQEGEDGLCYMVVYYPICRIPVGSTSTEEDPTICYKLIKIPACALITQGFGGAGWDFPVPEVSLPDNHMVCPNASLELPIITIPEFQMPEIDLNFEHLCSGVALSDSFSWSHGSVAFEAVNQETGETINLEGDLVSLDEVSWDTSNSDVQNLPNGNWVVSWTISVTWNSVCFHSEEENEEYNPVQSVSTSIDAFLEVGPQLEFVGEKCCGLDLNYDCLESITVTFEPEISSSYDFTDEPSFPLESIYELMHAQGLDSVIITAEGYEYGESASSVADSFTLFLPSVFSLISQEQSNECIDDTSKLTIDWTRKGHEDCRPSVDNLSLRPPIGVISVVSGVQAGESDSIEVLWSGAQAGNVDLIYDLCGAETTIARFQVGGPPTDDPCQFEDPRFCEGQISEPYRERATWSAIDFPDADHPPFAFNQFSFLPLCAAVNHPLRGKKYIDQIWDIKYFPMQIDMQTDQSCHGSLMTAELNGANLSALEEVANNADVGLSDALSLDLFNVVVTLSDLYQSAAGDNAPSWIAPLAEGLTLLVNVYANYPESQSVSDIIQRIQDEVASGTFISEQCPEHKQCCLAVYMDISETTIHTTGWDTTTIPPGAPLPLSPGWVRCGSSLQYFYPANRTDHVIRVVKEPYAIFCNSCCP